MEIEEIKIKNFIDKSKNSSIQALRIFNDPTFEFRTANFCILMIISWTSLIYAIFIKNKKEFTFKEKFFAIKIKEDEFHFSNTKPLIDCIKEYWKEENNPIRKNLELFIKIRNLIEHQSNKEVDTTLYPELVALFLNYKKLLLEEFNEKILENVEIFFPLIIDDNKININKNKTQNELIDYIKTYRENLDLNIINSDEYAFKIFILPKLIQNQNKADLTIEFIKYNQENNTDREQLNTINALIKERKINDGLSGKELTAKNIVDIIYNKHFWFTMPYFIEAWKKYNIRPENIKNTEKDKTNKKFCIYTGVQNQYRYNKDYIQFLLNKIDIGEIKQKIPQIKNLKKEI